MNTERISTIVRERSTVLSVALLALLAYVPALTAAPGRMPADSKLYVYLDPGRFIADTTTTFDPRLYAGWVPHQHIAYLWPTGPWFWTFERLGVPDWIAHRLWIGSLLFLAGLGVRWLGRMLGLVPVAALVAALVYQLSPYVLPYVSRTSVLLLPWAGLGWIVGLTVLASIRGRWRFSAAIALVVLTVGAVNATALAMIVPAPVLWLVHAAWQRTITWRRAAETAAKVALLSTTVSLWWMTMLIIQGRRGADVLAYSESLESVSFTSTATEVVRGLGYWLFYIRDSFAATTTASLDHLVSTKVVVAGFLLATICLAGIVATRWPHRRFAGMLVGAGVVLAVGVHPIDSPSPLMDVLLGDRESGLALALRSSTRAIPVLLLGLALGAGSLVAAARAAVPVRGVRVMRAAPAIAVVIGVLAVYNLPALRNGGLVDPALERDQDPPRAWIDAAASLDGRPDGSRVLQVPGAEFGAFRWGYTVDQPLASLTDRPVLTRDLLPLGSPAAMDLLFALDDRIQDGTLDVESVAPVARLLGVDTLWLANDVQYERFRLARPELVDALLTGTDAAATGLLPSESFGDPAVMSPLVEYLDEQSVGDPRVGTPLPPVRLVAVADPVPTVRVKDQVVVLSGSGDGIIDAAAAGLLDGTELVRYSASLDADALTAATAQARTVIVTDSNRDRAHHWRSSQDVHGATETGGAEADVLRFEPADQRLDVFDTTDPDTQTIAVQDGPVQAFASAYGEPFAYLPEHRPVMAIDGDLGTSWLVGDRFPAVGEFIRLHVSEPIDHVTLRQPDAAPGTRVITAVTIDVTDDVTDDGPTGVDDASAHAVTLDDRSLVGDGQRIDLPPTSGSSVVTITVAATSAPQPPIAEAIAAVGFAEIDLGLGPTVEVVRSPVDAVRAAEGGTPVAYVFTRLRADAQDRFRSDPEIVLSREFEVSTTQPYAATVTLRMPGDAPDALLSQLLGEPVTASGHLAGTPSARGAAAFDGDASTAWITPFDGAIGSTVTLGPGGSARGAATRVSIQQPPGDFSPITSVQLGDASGVIDLDVPDGPVVDLALPRPLDTDSVTITITGVAEKRTIDRRFGEPVTMPAAMSEITFDGRSPAVAPIDRLRADCRTDLLSLDGEPVGLSFDVAAADALAGRPIVAEVCDSLPPITAGDHRLLSAPGEDTGFGVDRVVLIAADSSAAPAANGSVDPTSTVLIDSDRHGRTVRVPPCPAGCWVVLGEGFNTGWRASTDGGDLGPPQLVDGNANGWWIAPSDTATAVTMRWTPQRALTIALVLSLLAALVALAIVVVDRRRPDDPVLDTQTPQIDRSLLVAERAGLTALVSPSAAAFVAVPTVAAALLIGWSWAIPAFVVSALAVAVGRRRFVAVAGLLIVAGVGVAVTAIVLRDRPFPNAGWPVRFEWLHGWMLLGIVLIAIATLWPDDPQDDVGDDAYGVSGAAGDGEHG